jgi:hypothetical protein
MNRSIVLLLVTAITTSAQIQSRQDWGSWGKSSQSGIQVRVFCKSDMPSRSDHSRVLSNWKYQFRNTTAYPIHLRWRAEQFDSGSGTNQLAPLATSTIEAGKTTPVMDTNLLGSCATLSAMHLMVVSRARPSGKPVPGTKGARTHTARSATPLVFAYQGTAPAVSVARSSAAEDAGISPGFRGIPNSTWQCEWDEQGKHSFVMSFDARGQYFITRDDGRDTFAGAPESIGNTVTWTDRLGRLYTLQVSGDTMSGKTSTFDHVQSRGRDYNGTIECNRTK